MMNRKWRYPAFAAIIFTLISLPACSQLQGVTDSSPIVRPSIVRQAELGSKWAMQQMTIEVPAGQEVKILLKLADQDRIDGYFYLENRENSIEFQIMADTLVYESKGDNVKTPGRVNSDRFTIVASKLLGSTYALIFRNPEEASKKTKVSIFSEIVYPSTASIFTEIKIKQ
jgi:hypothetical protein